MSAAEVCQRLKAYRHEEIPEGFKWLVLEYNDYGNDQRVVEYRQACSDADMKFCIWMTRNFSSAQALQACQLSQCDGFLAEAEIPWQLPPVDINDMTQGPVQNPQAQNWEELIFFLSNLEIYKGVVTTFAPFQKYVWSEERHCWELLPASELSAPLIRYGWSCHTECYDLSGSPPGTWIERRNFYATTHLKWPRTQPVAGPFGGRTMDDYPTFDQYPNGSAWAAEYLI